MDLEKRLRVETSLKRFWPGWVNCLRFKHKFLSKRFQFRFIGCPRRRSGNFLMRNEKYLKNIFIPRFDCARPAYQAFIAPASHEIWGFSPPRGKPEWSWNLKLPVALKRTVLFASLKPSRLDCRSTERHIFVAEELKMFLSCFHYFTIPREF